MAFYIALPDGDKLVIVSGESFNVRSNAQRYADRMGWGDKCFIATAEQKAMIESGQPFSLGTVTTVENIAALVGSEKESKNKRKRHVSR